MSFTARLCIAFAALVAGFGVVVSLVGAQLLAHQRQETLQRLSQGLARHIVAQWPALSQPLDAASRPRLDEVLDMLMIVNPAIEVYLLDTSGRIRLYLGDARQLRQERVELAPLREFLRGGALPILGTDPKSAEGSGVFSVAPLNRAANGNGGYLYIVLQGKASSQIAGRVSLSHIWLGALSMLAAALVATLTLGLLTFTQLTRPLRELARAMRGYRPGKELAEAEASGDEVGVMAAAFADLTARIEGHLDEVRENQAAHREVVANLAHDLRTPLTALHGHLEALQRELPNSTTACRHLQVALTQSDKVRRLSQQLFELASLQASRHAPQVERFRLDELVSDAVQKFDFLPGGASVSMSGPSPGPVVIEGDLQLIERAIVNLIDNARRHAPGRVQVDLQVAGPFASIRIEDEGPGLPAELRQRLEAGQDLRDPPLRRAGGGFGGLGLAIVQRIAQLHGGLLRVHDVEGGGSAVCLLLPLAPGGGPSPAAPGSASMPAVRCDNSHPEARTA